MGKIADQFAELGRQVEAEIDQAKTLPAPIPGPQGPAGPAGVSAPAPTPTAPGPQYYTVVSGDTAGAIAKKFGLTLWRNQDGSWGGTFADLNGHSRNWNLIYGGEKVRVA